MLDLTAGAGTRPTPLLSWWRMSAAKNKKLKALMFDFGGTLAFLDFELLAREFSREGRKLDALALEHAEYAGREAIDRHLMSGKNAQADNAAYEHFFRGWMVAAGNSAGGIPGMRGQIWHDTSRSVALAGRAAGHVRGARGVQISGIQTRDRVECGGSGRSGRKTIWARTILRRDNRLAHRGRRETRSADFSKSRSSGWASAPTKSNSPATFTRSMSRALALRASRRGWSISISAITGSSMRRFAISASCIG